MNSVRPKKNLGQHFLTDENIAQKIVRSLNDKNGNLIEIGAGTGVLSKHFVQKQNFIIFEIDNESVEYLTINFPEFKNKIIDKDFLRYDILSVFKNQKFNIIGNFPYNISSQIFFKILDNRNSVGEIVCMIQKEVALRIAEKPGSKTYGILSVLLQAFYDIDYLFTVNETVFYPPPKVKSAVIRLTRNNVEKLNCNENLFLKIVKTAFNQRRKMLRVSLKSIVDISKINSELLTKRPEQLSVNYFVELTNLCEKVLK